MKRGTPDHPKVAMLCSLLNIRKFEAVGILEMLWHFTAKYAPQGDIGKYSDKAIAAAVDWQRPTGARGVTPECKLSEALVEAGWLDSDPVHRLVVHGWEEHADQTLRRFLASKKLAFVQHGASLPLPLPLPIPEPIQKGTAASAAGGLPVEAPANQPTLVRTKKGKRTSEEIRKDLGIRSEWWSEFWAVYPCKDGMNPAMDAFERRVKTREVFDQVIQGARAYAARAAREPDLKLKYAQGWINDERWTDQISSAFLFEEPQPARRMI